MVRLNNNDTKQTVMPNLRNKTNVLLLTTSLLTACAHQPRDIGPPYAADAADAAIKPQYRDYWQTALSRQTSGPAKARLDKGSLWQRVGSQMALGNIDHPRIAEHVAYLKHHPDYVDTFSQRARPFLYYIVEEIQRRGLPMELALVPMVESTFAPDAVSPMRAAGLWQIMPATGKELGLTLNGWYDGRHDIHASTKAALDYLKTLNDFFGGDWLLTLAAYNCGKGTVLRAIEANEDAGKPADYWNLDLPGDTQVYVPRILALSRVVANPYRHGLALRDIRDEPYLYRVNVGPETDLSIAAAMTGISKEDIDFYNPCFKRGVTPPSNSPPLLLPRNQALALRAKLVDLKKWAIRRYYIVRRGDSLLSIARQHGITYQQLAQWNGLRPKSSLRPGQKLVLQNGSES